jgi:biopolymer transport protein ExbD
LLCVIVISICACASGAQPATQPAAGARGGKFPHLDVDVKAKRVRVQCEALRVEAPLEFFCCATGTNEHESVLRSPVKASHLHTALLMIGLEPGEPVHYSEAAKKWLPPHGPPLRLTVEFEKDGKKVSHPAYKLMRAIRTKEPMPAMTWIFAGSRVMPDGNYAADVTGYLVSIVNFDLTVIDVPALVSNANETLEWETNLDLMPEAGAAVTLIIEPAGETVEPDKLSTTGPIDVHVIKIGASGGITLDNMDLSVDDLAARLRALKQAHATTRVRIAPSRDADPAVVARVREAVKAAGVETVPEGAQRQSRSDVRLDEQKLDALRQRWEQSVRPHRTALREAAQTQYEVIAELRREQQRLIDEADRIQRLIDELQREFDEMTTPRPASPADARGQNP